MINLIVWIVSDVRAYQTIYLLSYRFEHGKMTEQRGRSSNFAAVVNDNEGDHDQDNYYVDVAEDRALIDSSPSSPPIKVTATTTTTTSEHSQQSMTHSAVFQVKDRYRLVYLAFLWFGLTGTVPWNYFITAEDYWQYKLRSVNGSDALDPTRRNAMQTNFGSYFNLASMFPGLVGFIICTIYSHRIPLHWRVVASLVIVLLQFVVTAAFSLIDTDSWQVAFFSLTMSSVVLMSVFNALFQASSFGMAGILPSKYMRAAMNGQAVGGVMASLTRILTSATTNEPYVGAYYFFTSAIVILVTCILAYVGLCRNRYYNFHSGRVVAMKAAVINYEQSSGDMDSVELKLSFWQMFSKLKVYAVSVVLVPAVSLACYPTIAILVVSVDRNSGNQWTGKLFLPFACFLLYNCADLCGRAISSWIRVIPVNSCILPALCVSRVALVPLLLACNVQPRKHFEVGLDSDIAFVLLITLIGMSNGYFITLCMSTAPSLVRKEHQEMAGVLMSFFMTVGICSGAIFAFITIQFL